MRALVVAVIFAMVATEAHAIVGGTPSTDPSVVALVRGEGAATELVCSATAIASFAVLTAAHCVQNPELPDAIVMGQRVRPVAKFVASGFDPTTLENDLAILVFEQTIPASPKQVELLETRAGDTMQLLGFGRTSPDDMTSVLLREGTATIVETSPASIVSRGPSFTCEGDSGGPALIGDRIVGVTSSGDAACAEHSRHIPVAPHIAFIDRTLELTAPQSARVGDRCWYLQNCVLSECRPAIDDPRLSFCTTTCDDEVTCPSGLFCLQGICHHPPPSPGALTSRCTIDEDCADELCLAPAGDDDTRCTRRCFSDLPGFECPSGTACEPASDDGEACFRAAEGGCCSGAPQPSILLALFVLLARRPRAGRQLLRGRGRP
ncbi:MAG: trypsin-like serine protease [Kofleriaceae bacterium]